jgi:hypothetical protein
LSREDYGLHVVSAIIDPGKPWQNGTNESFNGKFRDECLSIECFRTGREAHVVIEAWRQHYYTVRPHSSIGDLTPHEFKPHHPPIQADPTEPSQNNRLNFPTQVSPTAGQTKTSCRFEVHSESLGYAYFLN